MMNFLKNHIWQILFCILLAFNILVILLIISFTNSSYETVNYDDKTSKEEQALPFILPNTTIETLINDNLPYEEFKVSVNEEGVRVNIEQTVLGIKVKSSVQGKPVVDGDNIIIPLSDLNLANLSLSEDTLYTALRIFTDLPEGITMKENEKAIVIDSGLFEQYFGIGLQVDKIDYENNAWYFSINNIFYEEFLCQQRHLPEDASGV